MGANCCKVSNDKHQSIVQSSTRFGSSSTRFGSAVPAQTNSRQIARHHSPSWSFRWDHRTHIEEDIPETGNSSSRFSNTGVGNMGSGSSGNESPEIKPEKQPVLQKEETSQRNPKLIPQVQSVESNSSSPEIIKFCNNNNNGSTSAPPKIPTAPSSDLPEPSRRTRRSPGYTLYRQVSDSRIPSLKSSFNSLSNVSPEPHSLSNHHSLSNNSSDNWSMRTFSELVGSASQREFALQLSSSSFDSSSVITKTPLSPDSESCRICSRVLKEKSPFSVQKIYSGRENSVIAVLPCGHVYHADCLENVNKELDKYEKEVDKYEPNCPVCIYGEKFGGKLLGKGIRVSRNAVVDLDLDLERKSESGKRRGKDRVLRRFNRFPVLRRHFSTGSHSQSQSQSQRGDFERKKGFWGRYWKE
ncbi:hypothetical protein LUZ60_009786 [Juncus effusus]|nr:hypothetical protein LUZ60_009786 [Juncus effusus]